MATFETREKRNGKVILGYWDTDKNGKDKFVQIGPVFEDVTIYGYKPHGNNTIAIGTYKDGKQSVVVFNDDRVNKKISYEISEKKDSWDTTDKHLGYDGTELFLEYVENGVRGYASIQRENPYLRDYPIRDECNRTLAEYEEEYKNLSFFERLKKENKNKLAERKEYFKSVYLHPYQLDHYKLIFGFKKNGIEQYTVGLYYNSDTIYIGPRHEETFIHYGKGKFGDPFISSRGPESKYWKDKSYWYQYLDGSMDIKHFGKKYHFDKAPLDVNILENRTHAIMLNEDNSTTILNLETGKQVTVPYSYKDTTEDHYSLSSINLLTVRTKKGENADLDEYGLCDVNTGKLLHTRFLNDIDKSPMRRVMYTVDTDFGKHKSANKLWDFILKYGDIRDFENIPTEEFKNPETVDRYLDVIKTRLSKTRGVDIDKYVKYCNETKEFINQTLISKKAEIQAEQEAALKAEQDRIEYEEHYKQEEEKLSNILEEIAELNSDKGEGKK